MNFLMDGIRWSVSITFKNHIISVLENNFIIDFNIFRLSQNPESGLFTVVNHIYCNDVMFGTPLALDTCGFDPGKNL